VKPGIAAALNPAKKSQLSVLTGFGGGSKYHPSTPPLMRAGANSFLSLPGFVPDLGRVKIRRLWKPHHSMLLFDK
jgi:hypothetical protein